MLQVGHSLTSAEVGSVVMFVHVSAVIGFTADVLVTLSHTGRWGVKCLAQRRSADVSDFPLYGSEAESAAFALLSPQSSSTNKTTHASVILAKLEATLVSIPNKSTGC